MIKNLNVKQILLCDSEKNLLADVSHQLARNSNGSAQTFNYAGVQIFAYTIRIVILSVTTCVYTFIFTVILCTCLCELYHKAIPQRHQERGKDVT